MQGDLVDTQSWCVGPMDFLERLPYLSAQLRSPISSTPAPAPLLGSNHMGGFYNPSEGGYVPQTNPNHLRNGGRTGAPSPPSPPSAAPKIDRSPTRGTGDAAARGRERDEAPGTARMHRTSGAAGVGTGAGVKLAWFLGGVGELGG